MLSAAKTQIINLHPSIHSFIYLCVRSFIHSSVHPSTTGAARVWRPGDGRPNAGAGQRLTDVVHHRDLALLRERLAWKTREHEIKYNKIIN